MNSRIPWHWPIGGNQTSAYTILPSNDLMHAHANTHTVPIESSCGFHGLWEEKMFSPLLRWMEKAIKTAPARLFSPHPDCPASRPVFDGRKKKRGSEVMRWVVLLLCNGHKTHYICISAHSHPKHFKITGQVRIRHLARGLRLGSNSPSLSCFHR